MAGKRKSIEQRKRQKPRTKKIKTEQEKNFKCSDSSFTKEEKEEPIAIHILRSPKRAPSIGRNKAFTKEDEEEPLAIHIRHPQETSPNKRSYETKEKISSVDQLGSNSNDEDLSSGREGKEILIGADSDNDEHCNDNMAEEHTNKYEVRQRVLARDQDGILYFASVRRKLYGINNQKSISCLGIFDLSPEDLVENDTTNGSESSRKNGERKSQNNEGDNSQVTNQNEWHYFVHYEGWKTLWDRWVSESDIMEVTSDNIERMKQISKAHKELQLEFKEKSKSRKIQNAGLFLHQWKKRLEALNNFWDKKVQQADDEKRIGVCNKDKKPDDVAIKRKKKLKKKKERSHHEVLHDRSKLVVQSCLTVRQSSHIQAIPLSFALKRILVEDWENLNNSNFATDITKKDSLAKNANGDMVHVLPAKVTIRDALRLYLKEKGISWDGKTKHQPTRNTNNVGKATFNHETSTGTAFPSKQDQKTPSTTNIAKAILDPKLTNGLSKTPVDTLQTQSTPSYEDNKLEKQNDNVEMENKSNFEMNPNSDNSNGRGISITLIKEWTDMADGIVFYFEQALMARLLYPSELSQFFVLEDSMLDEKSGENREKTEAIPLKVDIYGCEHLLRLLAAIPRILDQHLQDSRKRKMERKQKKASTDATDEDTEEGAFVEIGNMILAKLQDMSRFLQKNQSSLFRSMYRKKNEEEIKHDAKIHKRQERRLKSVAAAAAAEAEAEAEPQRKLQNIKEETNTILSPNSVVLR